MISSRRCSRPGCGRQAVATLTYVYADQTAVLGPLALRPEPGCYDLCGEHARGLSAPRGWEVIRLPHSGEPEPSRDDLAALAEAVREAAFAYDSPVGSAPAATGDVVELGRRGHLTVLTDASRRRG